MGCCNNADSYLKQYEIENLIQSQLPNVQDGKYGGYSSEWNFDVSTLINPQSWDIQI